MKQLHTCVALRAFRRQLNVTQQKVAMVATMGCLHQGHLALIEQAKKQCDTVIVSLFVNPLQFNCKQDFLNYPQPLKQDLALLDAQCIDAVFTPTATELFPNGLSQQSFVEVPDLSHRLEGVSRPGHFRGVTTVVSVLLHLIQPHYAYFGEKDFQQLAIIRRMVQDLHVDVNICALPTVRDGNGLALSSRNQRLSTQGLHRASFLYQGLKKLMQACQCDFSRATDWMAIYQADLKQQGFTPERLDLVDADTLLPVQATTKTCVLLVAAWLENVRLIDQIVFLKN